MSPFTFAKLETLCPKFSGEVPARAYVAVLNTVTTYLGSHGQVLSFTLIAIVVLALPRDS